MDAVLCKGVFKIDTFSFVPHRDVKVSYQFTNNTTSFFSGAKQINRRRIHAEKSFAFTVSGLKEEMDALIAFYNKQHGMKKEFLFVYDGIEEHCFFAAPISVSAIRELNKVVGYEAEIKLACSYQTSPYEGRALPSDILDITPKDKVEHKIDWNTNVVSMILNARQETYSEPTETFTVRLVGTKENRDELCRLFNLHGTMPFTFRFDGKDYLVRFPDSIEITDKRSMTQIMGFESSFDLEVIKTPNNGTYYQAPTTNIPAIVVKEDLSLRDWYENGCMIKGVSYKNNLDAGLAKLQNFYITDCTNAFFEAQDVYEIPELDTTKCELFSGMFYKSKVNLVKGLDLSKATDTNCMFEGCEIESLNASLNMPFNQNAQCMFRGARNIKSLPDVTIGLDEMPRELFRAAYSLASVKSITIPNAKNLNYLFAGTAIERLPALDFPKLEQAVLMFGGCNSLKSISFRNSGVPTDVLGMFLYCFALTDVSRLNLTAVVPAEYPIMSKLNPDSTNNCLYFDLFMNSGDDYYNMFAENPSDAHNYPYIGSHPDGQVHLYGSALKSMTIIEDAKKSWQELFDKYYGALSVGGMIEGERNNSGDLVAEHYYHYHNSIDTLTIIDSDGKSLVRFKSSDKYDGYDWIEDYRQSHYGSGG